MEAATAEAPLPSTQQRTTIMEHKQDITEHEHPPSVEDEVTFFHDFIAGGVAGSASVIVGHPFDTIKVRMQTATKAESFLSTATSYGGVNSLFRGMGAPLSAACVINALIFSSYGWSSRLYDDYIEPPTTTSSQHDSSIKAFTCGAFAGFVQAVVICPMEHVKCRLQIQHAAGSPDSIYKGPIHATRSIISGHGLTGLFRGWYSTMWREVPAFGAYFAFYDYFRDKLNTQLAKRFGVEDADDYVGHHSYQWIASALAGGTTGALTWAMIYPMDVIKTRIQTMPMDTPVNERRILTVARDIIQKHGWRRLFRGINVTCFRAFPVNGIIFPVYEWTLMHVASLEY